MWRSTLWLGAIICALSLTVGFAAPEPGQRSDASIAASNILEGMGDITSKTYSFDQAGRILGRTEIDYSQWSELATQLADLIVGAIPGDIDSQVIEEIVAQLRDPYAWFQTVRLERAVGHIGSRAVNRLVQGIQTSSDPLIWYHFAEELAFAVKYLDTTQIDDGLIDQLSALLEQPDDAVRSDAARALGYLGPRAARALPALERSLMLATEQENAGGTVVVLGVRSVEIIDAAIVSITSARGP